MNIPRATENGFGEGKTLVPFSLPKKFEGVLYFSNIFEKPSSISSIDLLSGKRASFHLVQQEYMPFKVDRTLYFISKNNLASYGLYFYNSAKESYHLFLNKPFDISFARMSNKKNYVAYIATEQNELRKYIVKTGVDTLLYQSTTSLGGISWSQDDFFFLFHRDSSSHTAIFRYDVESKLVKKIPNSFGKYPNVSKDNQHFLSSVGDEIIEQDMDGNRIRSIVKGTRLDNPVYSPSGRFIAYVENILGRYQIKIRDIKGKISTELPTNENSVYLFWGSN